jgi:antitoxin VapB
MGLNLKNEEAHRLAQDLAGLTGESMTTAVTVAVRERLERIRKEQNRETFLAEIMVLAKTCAKHLGKRGRALDVNKLLYDENGLPK